jgi:hypothetical protein
LTEQKRRSGGKVFESELLLRVIERDEEKQLASRNVLVLKIRVSVVAHFANWTLLLDFEEYQRRERDKTQSPRED